MKAFFLRIARPWRVAVRFGNRFIVHRAATFADAIDWASQYPAGTEAVISHRVAGFVAARFC